MASLRALLGLVHLLLVNESAFLHLQLTRNDLYERVIELSIHELELSADPETTYFAPRGDAHDRGRISNTRWALVIQYFSVLRRRKRDWYETLTLYDVVRFPAVQNDYEGPEKAHMQVE